METTDPADKWINLRGLNIRYRDEGTGKPVVMIHGIFASLYSFKDWSHALSKNYRTVSLDLPGFGFSDSPEEISMQWYCEVLDEFFTRLGISDFVLCGNSLGGWIVWEYAYRFPDKASHLVLIAPAGFISKWNMPIPVYLAKAGILQLMDGLVTKATVKLALKTVYGNSKWVKKEVIEHYYTVVKRPTNVQHITRLARQKPENNVSRLKEITLPTLILWGKKDWWIPAGHAKKFKKELPHARVVYFDELGHVPMEENPEITLLALTEFLEKSSKKA